MPRVILTWGEVHAAATAGVLRYMAAMKKNREQKYGESALDRWSTDIEGCCAELAVAKYLDLYWVGYKSTASPGDVGRDGIEVRWTQYDSGHLLVHKDDNDNAQIVLVTGSAPNFDIKGCIKGCDAKRKDWWHEGAKGHAPSYWVPQTELRELR